MASQTAFQPTADLQPADDILVKFNCDAKKHDDLVILAKELEIVWGNDPRYWKYTKENIIMDVAELLTVCWLDVKGKIGLDNFKLGQEYCASFVVKRTACAQNLHDIKLALEFNGGRPPIERVVKNLNEILPADKWAKLKVADFQNLVGGCDTKMTVSLTNHDDTWKSGLKFAGILIQPVPAPKN